MPLTTIHSAPPLDSFTTLADHQSQTPDTFYNAKPVLHYHGIATRSLASRSQLSKLPIFGLGIETQSESSYEKDEKPEVITVDTFVTSENLTLFNHANSTGTSIPYPAITLHAIQRLQDPSDPSQEIQGLYMQLERSDTYAINEDEDEEPDIVEITLIPPPSSTTTSTESEQNTPPSIQALFEAVSNCSNLNPDPMQEDEDMDDADGDSRIVFEGSVGYEGISGLPGVQRGATDGGLPPPFPGSGGWITAENVGEYFDEEGNWIGGPEEQSLGEGAGRVRSRDEVEAEEEGEKVNGHAEEGDDSKRVRTE